MAQTKLILSSQNRDYGTSQNCRFVLKNPLNATAYQVKKIEIPHSFYNITDNNNIINWTDETAVVQVSTLTNGNYSIAQLLTHIGTVMSADTAGTAVYTASRDIITKKVTITNDTLTNFSIEWSLSDESKKLAYELGFFPQVSNENVGKPEPVDISGAATYTANHCYWIGSPKNILIKSSLANRALKPSCNSLAKGGGVFNILEQVLVNTVSGEVTTQEFINPDMVYIQAGNTIYDIDFQLIDEEFTELDLNGRDWSIQIVFNLE